MTQGNLFFVKQPEITGAAFSDDRKYRYALWRIWDKDAPKVMFIGLNPSTANETGNDATIKRVIALTKAWGYGGVYMLNCFPYVSTDPKKLLPNMTEEQDKLNSFWMEKCAGWSEKIVFAWGAFKVVRLFGKMDEIIKKFPGAYCLKINNDGSPQHPLFIPVKTIPIIYEKRNITT